MTKEQAMTKCTQDDYSRRAFMNKIAQATLGVTIMPWLAPQFARAAEPASIKRPTARNCIYLFMNGGMSHIDTWDPKPGTETGGPTKAISTSADGVHISEYLPRMAKHMNKTALIRGMTSTQGAHEQAQYLMHTSFTQRGTIRHPGMGAWFSYFVGRGNPTLPTNVAISSGGRHPGSGFLEAKYAPLPLGSSDAGLQHSKRPPTVSETQMDRRLSMLEQLNTEFDKNFRVKDVRGYKDLYKEAVQLMQSKDLAAFDLSKEDPALRALYGEDEFGQGCLLARRLIEHDVRFVEVGLGGWDTHDDNFDRVEARAEILDQALSALLTDLESRGLLEETLVVLGTDFGRTPRINGNDGRDHYPKAFSCLLAGGGVKGGQVHGATDPSGSDVIAGKVQVPDFNATIGYALGLPLDEVVLSPQGRPFTFADKGRPLTALF
jgi:Protein of unknown function (DUF1501)